MVVMEIRKSLLLVSIIFLLPHSVATFAGESPKTAEDFKYLVVDQNGWPSWNELKRFEEAANNTGPNSGFIKNYPACRPAACKKFKQSQLGISTAKIPIYVASLFKSFSHVTLSAPSDLSFLPELYAIEYALRYINEASSLLQNFELRVIHSGTNLSLLQCDAGTGLKNFINLLSEDPVKVMLIGGACSVVSLPVASVAHYWNLIQFSHASGSKQLSDKFLYPLFFRVIGGFTDDQPPKYLQFMKRFGYKHVAILYEIGEYYQPIVNELLEWCNRMQIQVIASVGFQTDPRPSVEILKNKDARVFINLVTLDARNILKTACEFWKHQLFGRKYVHMWALTPLIAFSDDQDWGSFGCSKEQMKTAVNNSFDFFFVNPNSVEKNVTTFPDMKDTESYVNLKTFASNISSGMPSNAIAIMDILMVVAQTLDSVSEHLQLIESNTSIAEFTYENTHLKDLFLQELKTRDFTGSQGQKIQFDENHDLIENISFIPVLSYWAWNHDNHFADKRWYEGIEAMDVPSYYAMFGGMPKDIASIETVFLVLDNRIQKSIYVVAAFIAIVGVICMIITFYHRDKKLIKLSSPKLNVVIALGGLVCLAAAAFASSDHRQGNWICMGYYSCLAIGVSLLFGSMFCKTWRVHQVFTSQNLHGSSAIQHWATTDAGLLTGVAIITVPDLVLLASWFILDPIRIETVHVSQEIDSAEDVVYEKYASRCESNYSQYFVITLVSLKGLLMLFGGFLAWSTRNVKIEQLNDSGLIGVCIYNVTIVSVISSVVIYLTQNQVTLTSVITCLAIFVSVSIVYIFVFIVKFVQLVNYNDSTFKVTTMNNPKSSNVIQKTQSNANSSAHK